MYSSSFSPMTVKPHFSRTRMEAMLCFYIGKVAENQANPARPWS
jgi:hypothetical protein